MISRFARLGSLLVSSVLVIDALAQNPPVTAAAPGAAPQTAAPVQPSVRPAAPEDELVLLKLPDADIDTVLSALEIYTGRIILRPQQLQTATYNLKIAKPIPKSEAILAIETVLALNNVGIAPRGEKFLVVTDLQKVKQEAPEMITGSAMDLPASGKVSTKLFQLEFARVQEMAPLLANVLNPFYGGAVPLPNANAVLITDSVSNLQRVELLLQQVDKPITAGMKPKFYTVKNVKASELVNKLRTILTGTLQTQLGTATTYNADDRTQQIVVVTDPRQWDFFSELIDRLDTKSDPNTRTEVLYLKNAKAKEVVDVLSNIIRGQTTAIQRQNTGSVRAGPAMNPPGGPQGLNPAAPAPAQPAAPAMVSATNADATGVNEFSAFMTVVNDERSNSVVVFGTSDDIRLVTQLVDKLDIVLAQVRIEVVIAEVTLDDTDSSGISSLGLRMEGDKLVGFSGVIEGPSGEGAVISDGTITRPGASGRMDLAATLSINSSVRKRNNSILTVPAILTSHGKKAKIFSGETRPVITGSVVSGTVGGVTSSTTQQEIGTTLTVTPFIGVDGSVQLELIQDVQDVIGTVQIDQNDQYIIGKRQTESYITIKSGEIIVLGGFRKNSSTRERGRLGPIPIIGDIFGPRTKGTNRQELIFFLRPIVLTNNPALDNAEDLKRIEQWSTRDAIKRELDPKFQPPAGSRAQSGSMLDKILPR